MRINLLKRIAVSVTVFMFVLFASWDLNAQSEKSKSIPPSDVAPPAMKTFKEKFPTASKVEWKMEIDRGLKLYEAEFQNDSKEYSAEFDEYGYWRETEIEIKFTDLPEKIQQSYFASKFKDAKILEVEDVSRITVLRTFQLSVDLHGAEYELLIDPSSGIIRENKIN